MQNKGHYIYRSIHFFFYLIALLPSFSIADWLKMLDIIWLVPKKLCYYLCVSAPSFNKIHLCQSFPSYSCLTPAHELMRASRCFFPTAILASRRGAFPTQNYRVKRKMSYFRSRINHEPDFWFAISPKTQSQHCRFLLLLLLLFIPFERRRQKTHYRRSYFLLTLQPFGYQNR